MTRARQEDTRQLEDSISRLRLVVVATTGLAWWTAQAPTLFALVWLTAAAYSVTALLVEPHRRLPDPVWRAGVSFIDWALIAAGVFASGAASELHVLFFLFVLSLALRIEPLAVAVIGVATAAAYLGTVWLTGEVPLTALLLRTGYILCISVGSAAVAFEIRRQIRARLGAEAHRTATQDITAAVSHDLLNPLSAIFGLVETLQDGDEPLTGTQQQTLTRITTNARRMNSLIRNLLDSEALERGTPSLLLRRVDVNALIERCAEAHAGDAEAKRLSVELDVDRGLSPAIADDILIERLVTNLLHNAIKFTPSGGSIRLSTRDRGARFEIRAWNSGQPIRADLIPVLFEKHTRSPESPGVGLGLYICRLAAELHGGEICLEHPKDGGVAFVVSMPLVTGRTPQPSRLPVAPPALKRFEGYVFSAQPSPASSERAICDVWISSVPP